MQNQKNPTAFDAIRAGDRVTIVNRFGQQKTGRAVMYNRQYDSWVLNMGGAHGTPANATRQNVVKISPKKNPNRDNPANFKPLYVSRATKYSNGAAYWTLSDALKIVKLVSDRFPEARAVDYEKGWAVQIEIGGDYLGKDLNPSSKFWRKKNPNRDRSNNMKQDIKEISGFIVNANNALVFANKALKAIAKSPSAIKEQNSLLVNLKSATVLSQKALDAAINMLDEILDDEV